MKATHLTQKVPFSVGSHPFGPAGRIKYVFFLGNDWKLPPPVLEMQLVFNNLRAVSSWDQLPYSDTQTLWWYRYIAEFIPGFSLPFDKNLQKVEQMVDKWFGDGKHVSLQELSEIVAVFGKVATTNTVRVKRSLDNFLGRTPPGPPPYIELGEQYFTTSGGSKGRQSVIFHELTHYSGGTWDYGYVDRPFKKQPTYTAGPHWPEPENPDPNMLYKPVHLDPPRLRKNADAYTGFVQDMEYFY